MEVAKALSAETKVLVLDEPTAVLPPNEASRLLELVRTLAQRGVSVIYISHRLEEIFTIADRVTVLKDGQTVTTCSISEVTPLPVDRSHGRTPAYPSSFRNQIKSPAKEDLVAS